MKKLFFPAVASSLLAVVISHDAFANKGVWIESERKIKCEKIIEAHVIETKIHKEFDERQNLIVASIHVKRIVQDTKPDKAAAQVLNVYYLNSKPNVVLRDASSPNLVVGKSYLLHLMRINNFPSMEPSLFVEFEEDSRPIK
jgi:hypothetical protein